MTPASVGCKLQINISGGVNPPSDIASGRIAQKKYVMHCMTRISQQECRGILEFLKVIVTIKIISCPVYSCKLFQY